MDSFAGKDLRASILHDSKNLLIAVQSGASDELLASGISRIQELERKLIRNQKIMLHPGMWKILQNRLNNRRFKEIIDTVTDLTSSKLPQVP